MIDNNREKKASFETLIFAVKADLKKQIGGR